MASEGEPTDKFCIYCARMRPSTEFSLEHIFPSALGGKACGSIFKSRHVCSKCNNILGLFADGAFVKSWFTTNGAADSAFSYLDPVNGGIVPYTYIGTIPDISDEQYICELWVGPSGENVYSQTIRDERFITYAGGDPIKTRKIGRDVVIFARTISKYWLNVGLSSFKAFFKNDRLYPGNFSISTNSDKMDWFTTPDTESANFIDKINKYRIIAESNGNTHSCTFTIDIGFADRFLAKLALGVGHSLFGDGYCTSAYAQHLRTAIWCKSTQDRKELPLRGIGYWNESADIDRFMSWPGAHTIMLQRFQNDVALGLYIFGKKSGFIVITDEFSKYQCDFESHLNNGVVYIIIPARSICTSPIPMMNFVSHRLGTTKHKELLDIESLKVELKDLPAR